MIQWVWVDYRSRQFIPFRYGSLNKSKFIYVAPWLICLKSQVVIFTCAWGAAGEELLGGGGGGYCNKTIQDFVHHSEFASCTPLRLAWPFQLFDHLGHTATPFIISCDITSSLALDFFTVSGYPRWYRGPTHWSSIGDGGVQEIYMQPLWRTMVDVLYFVIRIRVVGFFWWLLQCVKTT